MFTRRSIEFQNYYFLFSIDIGVTNISRENMMKMSIKGDSISEKSTIVFFAQYNKILYRSVGTDFVGPGEIFGEKNWFN